MKSGRPYKLILSRLESIHGYRRRLDKGFLDLLYVKSALLCSLSWLKNQFRRLGLKRRPESSRYTPRGVVKNCIKVSFAMNTADSELLIILIFFGHNSVNYDRPIAYWAIGRCGNFYVLSTTCASEGYCLTVCCIHNSSY